MVKYVCDGCKKEVEAFINSYGDPFKPDKWFSRQDKDGPQHACSRECIEKISNKTGKTSIVAPF